MKYRYSPYLAVVLLTTACSAPLEGESILGFDVSNSSIPTNEIHRGGPPPDGIPSIDDPQFTPVDQVDFLRDDDIVLGFEHQGEKRAYPFRILVWHEIVNDLVGGKPIMATYCPLCGTAMVFGREYKGQTLTFGVSGLLYNSDVLMFDRQTRSLWSQLGLEAISGEFLGTELQWLPSEQMTWAAWKQRHPESKVLNTDTGHRRDYFNLPYESYFQSSQTMFPYERNRADLEAKAWVAGVRLGDHTKAYPLEKLPDGKPFEDTIGNTSVTVSYDKSSSHLEIVDSEGNPVPVVHSFWFAWQAFYPETSLWQPILK